MSRNSTVAETTDNGAELIDAAQDTGTVAVKTYDENSGRQANAVSKSPEESAMELAHSELLATGRICSKFRGRMTRLNALSMGESAMEALANYYAAYNAFEKSCA